MSNLDRYKKVFIESFEIGESKENFKKKMIVEHFEWLEKEF